MTKWESLHTCWRCNSKLIFDDEKHTLQCKCGVEKCGYVNYAGYIQVARGR